MRILIDLTSLDDNFSGMEHYALLLSKELIKDSSHHFHLVFKNKISYFSKEELDADNISYHIIDGGRYKTLLFSLPKYIKTYNPDCALFLAFPPSLLWKPKDNLKVITMIHDMVAFDVPKTMTFKSKLYFKKSIKHALKISDEILTNSQFSKNRILFYNNKFNSNKIHVAYCASGMQINQCDFKVLKEKYSLPDKYLLSLSTIEPRKNFNSLIAWLDNLWSKNKLDIDLVLVGRKGWKVEKILKNVKNIDRVHFTGFVDDEHISSIYKKSTCFIFPSIYEGFGIPILESVLSGKLPLCSSIDVFKEILGDNYPFYFDYQNEEDFSKKLFEYLSSSDEINQKLLKEISLKTSIFDWKKSADVVKGLFK